MNTIPSTFNEFEIDRVVLWGRQVTTDVQMDISVILLNRSGSHLRTQVFDSLLQCGFKTIISVEPVSENYNIEEVSRRYPMIKFIIPREESSDGNLINSCISEFDSKYFLVLRDCFNLPKGLLTKNLAENLMKDNVFCIVPRLVDKNGSAVINNFVPDAKKGRFLMVPEQACMDGTPTVYPFDYIGLYNREKFIKLGGYDYTITSHYWQNVDFSLRAWLWGEKTLITTKFQISYIEEVPLENAIPDFSYIRFYLKNVLPKFRSDHGAVPHFSFLGFYLRSKCGIFQAWAQYKEAKNWIRKNQFRFKQDVQYIIENWTEINDR